MAIDVLSMWNFRSPEESEQKFLLAIPGASIADQLILQTQIARTYGMRRDFEKARLKLKEVEPHLDLSTEVATRYHLELGRTFCSAIHKTSELPREEIEEARSHYIKAFEIAKNDGLDYLAIDALHMMTCVDTEPHQQIDWNRRAIEFLESSNQSDAKKWEASLRNNLGYSLHLQGNYDEAIEQFEICLDLRLKSENIYGTRVAKWMIAWTHRAKGNLEKALEMQLALEREHDEAGEKDPYVFEELEAIYRAMGDDSAADKYKALKTS